MTTKNGTQEEYTKTTLPLSSLSPHGRFTLILVVVVVGSSGEFKRINKGGNVI